MERIVKAVFGANGHVFGGYVRDMMCGKTPKDVDCFIPANKKDSFWASLLRFFPEGFSVVKAEEYGSCWPYTVPYMTSFQRLIVHGEKNIQVDICGNPLFMPDFDVNMLKFDGRTISLMKDHDRYYRFSISSVLQHIREHKAMMLSTCNDDRLQKMRDAKWEVISVDYSSV